MDVILGMNGFVWVYKSTQALPSATNKANIVTSSGEKDEEGFDAESVYSNVNDVRLFVSFLFPLFVV